MTFELTSPSFQHGEALPTVYTCQGADRSPALRWNGTPVGTQSLALIVEDPDVPDPAHPVRTWIHWVLSDLPPETTTLAEGIKAWELPEGTREGTNDWNRKGYGGPCPPIGRHRYYFRLYALSAPTGLPSGASREELARALEGKVLGRAELMGTYQR